MKRPCPKCRGSGNEGRISTLRCASCSGRGQLDVRTPDDRKRYTALVLKFGSAEPEPEPEPMTDDGILGLDFDDGLDDTEVASLGWGDGDGDGDGTTTGDEDGDGWPDDYNWPDDDDDDVDNDWGD